MKKILCLTLAVLMLLSLCACGGSTGSEETPTEPAAPQLKVGFGRVNITPSYPVGMSSSGTEKHRRHTGLISYVYATCIAVEYGEETYLLYTVDTISIDETLGDILRVEIVNQFPDIKLENIFFGATHTHSAPANRFTDNEAEGKYRQEFIAYMPQAAKLAMNDLAPATVEACKFDIEGMNFVRHYVMNDGTYAGSNFGETASGYKEHTYDPNHEMILVRFPREGKDPIILVNWAAHPANPYDEAIGWLNISADHPGWCREELERLSGAKVAYFNGASGDTVPDSQIEELKHGLNAKEYGTKLGQIAYEHLGDLKPVEVDNVASAQQKVSCKIPHEQEHLLAQCKEIYQIYSVDNNKTLATQMAKELGLSSVHHAGAIAVRASLGESEERTVSVFRIGQVSFSVGTYEMASEHAGELKAASPYEFTFQICSNSKYIPREEAIDYHSYEGDTRRYTRETGDMMVEKYLEMLNAIK